MDWATNNYWFSLTAPMWIHMSPHQDVFTNLICSYIFWVSIGFSGLQKQTLYSGWSVIIVSIDNSATVAIYTDMNHNLVSDKLVIPVHMPQIQRAWNTVLPPTQRRLASTPWSWVTSLQLGWSFLMVWIWSVRSFLVTLEYFGGSSPKHLILLYNVEREIPSLLEVTAIGTLRSHSDCISFLPTEHSIEAVWQTCKPGNNTFSI
jgi:hypothetical protein